MARKREQRYCLFTVGLQQSRAHHFKQALLQETHQLFPCRQLDCFNILLQLDGLNLVSLAHGSVCPGTASKTGLWLPHRALGQTMLATKKHEKQRFACARPFFVALEHRPAALAAPRCPKSVVAPRAHLKNLWATRSAVRSFARSVRHSGELCEASCLAVSRLRTLNCKVHQNVKMNFHFRQGCDSGRTS